MRKKSNVILTLILTAVMVFICVGIAQAKDSSGSTDISSEAVDSITINDGSSANVNAYVDFSVTVNFSEDNADGTQKSDVDIESGDQIFVSWDAPDGVTFTGYSETINLYQDGDSSGTLLGTAVVAADGVTITFNDNVNDLQHVNGSVTFTIDNYGNTTDEDGGTGTISAGSVMQSVTINHAESTGIGAFGAKGGAYYTNGENKIDWWLWINAEEKSDLTGTITITDTLPDTETLDSFTAFSLRNGGLWNWGVFTLDNFNSLVGSFVYDESTNTITITISEEFVTEYMNGNAAVLHFTTTSTAEAGTEVSNTAYWTYYQNDASTPYVESHTGIATVPSTSGSVSGLPKGTIQITKVVNGTTDPIEWVTFRVYKVNSSTDHTRVSGWYDGADYAEVVTDEDGIAAISDLEDGVYEIEEVTTNLPNWIAVPDTTSTYATISGTAGTAVTIENSVKTTDVTATKKWVGSDGTTADTGSHPTVYFKLYRSVSGGDAEAVSGAAIKKVKTAAGKSRTSVTWTDLPEYDNTGKKYTYSVREVDADGNDYTPAGYTKTEEDLTVINTLKKSSTSTSGTDSKSKTNDSDQVDSGKTDNDTVQTGDTSSLGLWMALLVVSAAVLAVIGYRKRRNNDH